MPVALSDYRTKLRQVLHDSADVLYPLSDKDLWINDALFVRDWLTGGYRNTLTVACSTSTDTYTYAQLGNANIFDIIGISVLDGSLRIPLAQLTLTRLNRTLRIQTSRRDRPVAWAWVGQSIILDCIASTTDFDLETDAVTAVTALTLPNDQDALPKPWTDPVTWYAAHLAKLNARRLGEADYFFDKFVQSARMIPGARVGLLPSVYGGRPI